MGVLRTIDPRFTRNDGTDIAVPTAMSYALRTVRGAEREQMIADAIASGDWSDVEAWSGVNDDAVHTLLDPSRRGESETYTTRAPSWSVATVSERKVSRGKKGTSVTVTRRGFVPVIGDSRALDDAIACDGRVPRVVISHAIDALRVSRHGHADGDKLAALATRLYGLPELKGTDHYSWSEATNDMQGESVALALHTCGISGGTVPALDLAVGPEYRTYDDDPRSFPSSYGTARKVRPMPTRRRVAVPRKRKNEETTAEHVVLAETMPWRTWCHVTELPAGADDNGAMFVGHRKVRRTITARQREQRNREARVIGTHTLPNDVDIVDVLPNLAVAIAGDGKGVHRWSTENGERGGSITIDARGRISLLSDSYTVRRLRTVEALRLQLSAALK